MLSSSPAFTPATAILEARVTFLEQSLGTVSAQLAQLAEYQRIVQATIVQAVQPVMQTDNPTLQQLDPRSPGVFVPDSNGFRDDKYDHLGYLEVEEDGVWRFADIYELSQQAGIVVLHYVWTR